MEYKHIVSTLINYSIKSIFGIEQCSNIDRKQKHRLCHDGEIRRRDNIQPTYNGKKCNESSLYLFVQRQINKHRWRIHFSQLII